MRKSTDWKINSNTTKAEPAPTCSPATEAPLPEPVLPKEQGFFEKMFSRKQEAAPAQEESAVVVEIEEGLDEPVTEIDRQPRL